VGSLKALFDTNILIDYLNGHDQAWLEISRYDVHLISRITWMEVLAGAESSEEEVAARLLLSMFTVTEIDGNISEEAVRLRKIKRLRLPDAIILATSVINNCLLITRNSKDFDEDQPMVRVPYKLKTT